MHLGQGKRFFPWVILLLGTILFPCLAAHSQSLTDKGRLIGTIRNERNEVLSSATLTVSKKILLLNQMSTENTKWTSLLALIRLQ